MVARSGDCGKKQHLFPKTKYKYYIYIYIGEEERARQ